MTSTSAASLTHASRDVALELHRVLKEIDGARWRPELERSVRGRLRTVRTALTSLLADWRDQGALAGLLGALRRVAALLDTVPGASASPREARRAWRAFRKELLAAYDALSTSLEAWDIHVPGLRPSNYARNVFHVGWGCAAITVLGLWPDRTLLLWIIGGLFVWAWTMETLRRSWKGLNDVLMRVLGRVAHPHEWHRVNSATWYTTALLVLAWTGVLTASVPALAVLAFGDPAAAVVGRRFGRTRLANGRSLEGTLAFVVLGGLAAFLALWLTHPEIGLGVVVAVALAAAIVGSLAELFSRRVDDNLSIPLSAATAAALVLGLFGFAA